MLLKWERKRSSEVIKINAYNNAKVLADLEKWDYKKCSAHNSGLVIESAYYNLGSGKVDF